METKQVINNWVRTIAIIVFGIAFIAFLIRIFTLQAPSQLPQSNNSLPSIQPSQATSQKKIPAENIYQYEGEEGKDALTLLKEKTTVEQDESGLVVSINGRTVDAEKREFWAFYVNEALSDVGPAEYMTATGDKLVWKIENY